MDEELEELIKKKVAAGRYAEAARLAASLDDVIARELWFEHIADAQIAAYVEQMEEEEAHQEPAMTSPWPVRSLAKVHYRQPTLIQEKSAYDNAHA